MKKIAVVSALCVLASLVGAHADTIRAVELGCHQITSFSGATGFPTIDTGATFVFGSVEGNSVRFRDDGVSPTASVGVLIQSNATFYLTENLSNVQFVPTTGTATINYCDYR